MQITKKGFLIKKSYLKIELLIPFLKERGVRKFIIRKTKVEYMCFSLNMITRKIGFRVTRPITIRL